MRKCKAKATQADLGKFTHIQVYLVIFRIQSYSGIIQAHFEPCVTLAYSKLWYIQNAGISKTMAHAEPEIYSEFWAIENPGIFRTRGIPRTLSNIYDGVYWETVNLCSCTLVHEINMIFLNAGLIFTPDVFIQCKKVLGPGMRAPGPWILMYLLELVGDRFDNSKWAFKNRLLSRNDDA